MRITYAGASWTGTPHELAELLDLPFEFVEHRISPVLDLTALQVSNRLRVPLAQVRVALADAMEGSV